MTQSVILPEAVRDQILAIPEHRMGVHRVTIETHDGRTFPNVEVAWGEEVIRVPGHKVVPFGTDDVVAAYQSP